MTDDFVNMNTPPEEYDLQEGMEEAFVEETPVEEVEEEETEEPFVLTDDELKKHLLSILQDVEREENGYRSNMLQVLRKLDLFWHGIQRLYWSEQAEDYLTISDIDDPALREEVEGLDEVINIYRAHGESIIAALSTGIPGVNFGPADADSPVDILTAKGYSKLAELIQRRNKAPLLFLKALFTLWNQHFVAAYHYSKEDKAFGTYSSIRTERRQVNIPTSVCGECGEELQEGAVTCPLCNSEEIQSTLKPTEVEEEIEERIPKSSQVIEIYGPLNVMIKNNARTIQDTGILTLYTENDIAKVLHTYPELADKLTNQPDTDEDAQTRATHNSTIDENNVTVKQVWIRPWMFWRLGVTQKEVIEALYQRFPDGVYFVSVQDEVTDIHPEALDDRWTLTESPISRTVIADPMGQAVVSIQETVNDLYSLSNDTAKHAIPETFYDSRLIDGQRYSKVVAKPGMFFPVLKQPGQQLAESIFQMKPATLSKEIDVFRARNDTDAQFVTGAFPSIYGGPNEGSSGTLGEYSLSKNMALQRLQIHWKTLVHWWTDIIGKTTADFHANMKADEKFAKRQNGAHYVNVIITKAELDAGKIGEVEPNNSEQLPMSWAQKRDLLIQLVTLNNEQLNFTIFHPENANLIAQTLGVPEIYIPGDEDRTKQLIEIGKLLVSPPNPGMPTEQGMAPEMPSIMPEQEVDNHAVHIEVCKAWCNSEAGQEAKYSADRSQGYKNVLLHIRAHMQMMPPPMPETPVKKEAPKEKPKPKDTPETVAEPNVQ